MRLECWNTFFLWPLIYFRSSGGSTTVHLLFSLIIWYRSAVETSVKLGLIFLWVTKSASKFLFFILGIIWYSNKNGNIWFHIFPLVFYSKNSSTSLFVIFPFLWVKTTSSSTTVFILPVIYIKIANSGTRFFLIPFIYVASTSSGFQFFLVPIIWVSSYTGGYKFIIAPIFFVIRSTLSFRFILFPLLWYGNSTNCTTVWFVPIWYRRKSETTTVFVVPAVYYRHNSSYTFIWGLAFWFTYYMDGSYNWSIAYIIYFFCNPAQSSSTFILFPLFWYFNYAESDDWRFIFFPLLWLRKSHAGSHTVFFPIVWVYTHGHRKTVVVFPVFYKVGGVTIFLPVYIGNKKSGSDYFHLFTIFYYHKWNSCVSWCLFPIIWAHKNHEIKFSRFIFLPVYYYINSEDEKVVHFWPIFGKTTRPNESMTKYYVAWPLAVFTFTSEGSNGHIFPLLKYRKSATSSFFISLLVYRRKTETEHVLFVLLLYLFMKKPNYQLRVITPALYYSRFSNGNLFKYAFLIYLKLISDSEHTTFVYFFPLYGKETRGHSSVRHYLLYPIFSRRVDREAEIFVLDILWPLFHYETTPSVKSVRVLLYWHRTSPYRDFRIFLPLYFSFTQKMTRELSVEFSRSGSLQKSGSLANVNINDIGATEDASGELPESESGSGAVALAEISKKSPKKENTQLVSKTTVFFPFFIRRETDSDGLILGSPFLIFPPIFVKKWDKKSGDYSTWLFPFYSHHKKGTTDTKTLLIIFMRYFKDIELDIVRFNLLLYFYRHTRSFTSYFVFPFFYRSKSPEYASFMILILFFWSKHKGENPVTRVSFFWIHPHVCTLISREKTATSTKVFFFPLFWRQTWSDTGRFASAFFWVHPQIALAKYRTQDDRKKFFVFPLWYLRNEGDRSSFSLLWLFLPQVAMYRSVSASGETVVRWLWPLIYRSKTGSETITCMLWILPFVSMIKSVVDSTKGRLVYFFPFFYYKSSSSSSSASIFALIWFFHPYASMFFRARVPDAETTQTWVFPLVWVKHTGPAHAEHAFLWFFHPRASLVYRMRTGDDAGLNYFLFLYWHRFAATTSDWGFIWFFHIRVALIYWHKNYQNEHFKIYFWPLFWVSTSPDSRKMCMLYLFPPRFAFISSTGSGNVTIFLLYCARNVGDNIEHSLIYILHPKLTLIKLTRGPQYFGFWIFLIIYIASDSHEESSYFSLIWIYPRRGYAFITRNTYGGGDMGAHIFMVYWKVVDEGNYSFGFFWFLFYKLSLFAFYSTPEYTKHYFLLLYFCNSNPEAWSLSILLWLIYITSSDDLFQFRVIYRFFRIATGRKTIVELQPLFHYKSKAGEYVFTIFGCFGWGSETRRGSYCRVTCCTCDV